MSGIFLSYRRKDSQDVAGRIYDRLVERFSRDAVFKDVDSITLGASFPASLEKALKSSDVLLVLIGSDWLTCRSSDGQRRLDNPSDFVRTEIETALRLGLPTIPITLEDTPMPSCSDLPESLQPLGERQGQAVRPDPDFHRDMDRLIHRLVPLVKAAPARGLSFVTNRLDNDEFLFSGPTWPFSIDPRGEDISSKHTVRSERRGLVANRSFNSPHPTIAANELIIDFHLHNAADTSRYIERLYLAVERVFPVTPGMSWNTWLPVLEPHRFEVVLDPRQEFYELDFAGRLIEVPAHGTEHFRLKVRGRPECTERIFRFRLGAAAHDAAGDKEEVASDRTYHLAFARERFASPPEGE